MRLICSWKMERMSNLMKWNYVAKALIGLCLELFDTIYVPFPSMRRSLNLFCRLHNWYTCSFDDGFMPISV